MALLHVPLFMFWFVHSSFSMPVYRGRPHINWIPRKFTLRRSSPLPNLDRHAILAARTAALRKFHNAPALLAGRNTSPGYVVPSSLQDTYNRASDYVTDITFHNSSTDQLFYSSSMVSAATLGNEHGEVVDPLTDQIDGTDDIEYYGQLSFGSENQSLQMDFDTGSADLWVPVGCQDCGMLSQFQASASTTYRNTSQPFAVEYGEGNVVGTLASDTVRIASLEVSDQYFGGVRSVSENFASSQNDGIVGLAFSTIATSRRPTLFENLIPQLPAPIFSIYLTRTQPHGSEICLGGIDVQKTRVNAVSWVPVTSRTYWTVNISSVLVNDAPVQIELTHAIIDTGTSFIYGPSRFVSAIYNLIPDSAPASDYGDGFYTYPCDTHLALSFVLGPHTLPMDARDMNLGTYPADLTGSTCIGAIASLGSSDFDFFILGDSFLKSYISIYDYSHGGRVGFAESINE